jgi:LPPG:FO 2-phospho-L-lactate transferase
MAVEKGNSPRELFYSHHSVVALAGGVGGARMAYGLAHMLPGPRLTVIVNVGDDFEHYGLKISPDLDTVCYTLAGLENPQFGWGRNGESWRVIESAVKLGGPDWFRLGDQDLATHLERTRRLRLGHTLTQVTQDFCAAWDVPALVLPVSDDPIPTIVHTKHENLTFQEYFVLHKCAPQVTGFTFENVENSAPTAQVMLALQQAALVVICPSNPFVSVEPILAVPGIREVLIRRRAERRLKLLAVSPIIGGKTVKGPAAKMYQELGFNPSALEVARQYVGLLDGFVLDVVDESLTRKIQVEGIQTRVTDTVMVTPEDRTRLASEVLEFGFSLFGEFDPKPEVRS